MCTICRRAMHMCPAVCPRLTWRPPAVLCNDTVVHAQDAKAAALGPRHQVNMLAEVLAEPMLSTVQRQADTAAANGWFWTYQLDGVKVRCDLVECSRQGQLPT